MEQVSSAVVQNLFVPTTRTVYVGEYGTFSRSQRSVICLLLVRILFTTGAGGVVYVVTTEPALAEPVPLALRATTVNV